VRRRIHFLFVAVIFCALALPCRSQENAAAAAASQASSAKGAIAGTVSDTTGAVIPGVSVTALDAAGQTFSVTSDEKGEFKIEGLAPGLYKIVATAANFADFLKENIDIKAGETAKADFSMSPASAAAEKVEVTAGGIAKVEQETAQIAGSLSTKEVTTYALNGRNFTQLIALAPGVSNQTGQDEALVGVKGSVKYSVNGGRVEYNTYDVDGGDILNASINGSHSTLIVYPSIDAISELQVLTSNYGAMYGRTASGTILATTKQGGSDFHGDAYFFLRDNHLNARNFFDQTSRAPLYQKYEPGGTIGGPVFIPGHYNVNKDKTFFFFSMEYRHDKEPVNFNQAVPSAIERNCAAYPGGNLGNCVDGGFGDFSDVCPDPQTQGTLFFRDPSLKGKDSSNGKAVGYFPDCPGRPAQTAGGAPPGSFQSLGSQGAQGGNLVPIDARSRALLDTNLIPMPNSTTGCNSTVPAQIPQWIDPLDHTRGILKMVDNPHCYNVAVSPLTTWLETLFRIDHNFSSTQKLMFRFIHDDWSTQVPTPQWGFIHNSFPTVQNQFDGPGTSMVMHYTATIKNKLVNDVAMAYTTDHIDLTNFAGPGVTTLDRSQVPYINNPPCLIDSGDPDSTPCGLGWIFNNGYGNKMPGIVIAGTNAAYGGSGFAVDSSYMPWRHSNPTYSPRDDATLAFGKHTLQFGALFIIAQRNEVNPPVGANNGALQGIATFTNVNNTNTTGNVFADFLQPYIQNFQQDSAQGTYHNNYKIAEPYFQDNWKVTPRLTLNLGVRLSLFGLYEEKYRQSYNWFPSQFSSQLASQVVINGLWGYLQSSTTGDAIPLNLDNLDPHLVNGVLRCGVDSFADGKKIPAGCMSNKVANWAPRIGVAWDPFGNGKTSIRAGYGIFYEHGTGNEANTGSLEGSPGNIGAGGVVNMTQYYPLNWGCIGNQGTGCPAFGGTFPLNVTSIPTKAVWPYAQQWSLSVQRELPWDILGSVAYVGSRGTNLTAELQTNQLVPVNTVDNPFLPGQPLTSDICSGYGGGVFTVNGETIGAGQGGYNNLLAACAGLALQIPTPNALRQQGYVIAPGMGQVFSLQNIANSNYNSLQVTARRTKGPLTLGVSYTLSHSIDDSSDRTSANFINAYNLRQNRASSDFDQRHLLNISYIYALPLQRWLEPLTTLGDSDSSNQVRGRGMSDKTKTLLDGWEFSGITIYSTGTPFSIINGGCSCGVSSLDNAGVAAVTGPGSYPDLATDVPKNILGGSSSNTFGPLLGNPGLFVAPQGLTYGTAGRNFFNNPSRLNFDIAIAKTAKIKEDMSMQFRLEVFNVFNHTQFRIYDPSNPGNPGNNIITCYASATDAYPYSAVGTVNNGIYGDQYGSCLNNNSFLHPVDAHRPRTMQVGVKFFF